MKRTPWFNFDQKPVRNGFYEVKLYAPLPKPGSTYQLRWERGQWYYEDIPWWLLPGEKWRGVMQ